MAEHFASVKAVVAWQTDNELYCEFSECHCPSCQENFRLWLRAKYGTLDALNRAWGTQFWSQTIHRLERNSHADTGKAHQRQPGSPVGLLPLP